MLAVVLQDQGLGLGLGPGVGVERIGGGGHGLVGPEMVAAFVDAERADVDEPLDAGPGTAASSSRRRASTLRRRNSSSVPQSPTLAAQLKTQSAPATPAASASGSSRSPTTFSTPHWSSQRVSLVGRTRARTRWPRLQGLFGRVAADQPGGAGDEDRFRMASCSWTRFSTSLICRSAQQTSRR